MKQKWTSWATRYYVLCNKFNSRPSKHDNDDHPYYRPHIEDVQKHFNFKIKRIFINLIVLIGSFN